MTSRHCRSYDTYSPRLQCNSRVTRLPLEPKSSFHPILRLLLLAIRRKNSDLAIIFHSRFEVDLQPRLPVTGCLLAFAVVEFDLGRFQGGNRERTRPRPDLSLSFFFLLAPLALSLRRVTLRVSGLAAASSVSATASLPHHTPCAPRSLLSPGRPIAINQSSSRDTNRTRWPPSPPRCSLLAHTNNTA